MSKLHLPKAQQRKVKNGKRAYGSKTLLRKAKHYYTIDKKYEPYYNFD